MRTTILDTAEDIEWLRSTHCPTLPLEAKFAVLHGNEDSPDLIEWFDSAEPLHTDKPFRIDLEMKRQADLYVETFGSLNGFAYKRIQIPD